MNIDHETDRIRKEYERRKATVPETSRYSWNNPAYRFECEQRNLETEHLLKEADFKPVDQLKVLDAGCGRGQGIQALKQQGFSGSLITGLDLLEDRLKIARYENPEASLVCGNLACLPFPDNTFSLVVQSTVFSSVLDSAVRKQIASELVRVTKPGGFLLWYDFIWNPFNRMTRGIGKQEVLKLFPDLHARYRKVTLAPPLARALIGKFPGLCENLSRVSLLRTHGLALIGPKREAL